MSATPINLNKARKAKARAEAETQASENRVKFGRTKAARQASNANAEKTLRRLDDHKRER